MTAVAPDTQTREQDPDTVSGFSQTPALRARLLSLLERNPFPIALVSLVGIVLLTTFAPSLVVGDTWLTLMAGREIVEHGLPHDRGDHDPRPGRDLDRPAVARPARLLRRARARRPARGRGARHPPRPARALAGRRRSPLARRVLPLDVPDRPARRARRPVGLDDPRAVGRTPALRRRPLAPRRRLPKRHPPSHAARPPTPRAVGEPARLCGARCGTHCAARAGCARPRPRLPDVPALPGTSPPSRSSSSPPSASWQRRTAGTSSRTTT